MNAAITTIDPPSIAINNRAAACDHIWRPKHSFSIRGNKPILAKHECLSMDGKILYGRGDIGGSIDREGYKGGG
jgi:hypothetical protein